MKSKNKKLRKISDILSWISTILLIIPTIILWWFVGKTETIILITALVGIIIIINISTIIINKIYDKKVVESVPLMKHRLNKFLTQSIFFFAIGFPLFIDSWKKGFSNSLIQLGISVFFILMGEIIYVGYVKRDKIIENQLIKQNNKNKK